MRVRTFKLFGRPKNSTPFLFRRKICTILLLGYESTFGFLKRSFVVEKVWSWDLCFWVAWFSLYCFFWKGKEEGWTCWELNFHFKGLGKDIFFLVFFLRGSSLVVTYITGRWTIHFWFIFSNFEFFSFFFFKEVYFWETWPYLVVCSKLEESYFQSYHLA